MTPPVIVIGAGPAGLRATEILSAAGVAVAVYDRMPTPARKLLLAGVSGLNLSNAEPTARFALRYGERAAFFADCLAGFSADDLCTWAAGLGIETFVGSSGRIFPRMMKGSGLVRAWIKRLGERGVTFHPRQRWLGWADDGALRFADAADETRETVVPASAVILALGGASWPRMGSDGTWTTILAGVGIPISPLRPANMGFTVGWSEVFRARCEGRPVKNVMLTHAGARARGDFVITATGIEGGPVYTLSRSLREAIERDRHATLAIDLKPEQTAPQIRDRIERGWGAQSLANVLRKALRFDEVHALLLREVLPPTVLRDPAALAAAVKSLPLNLVGAAPLDRAISTAGGVSFDAVTPDLMLMNKPGVFVAGEMLDWEAPTGGYLVHGCLATGARAARGVLGWLNPNPTADPTR